MNTTTTKKLTKRDHFNALLALESVKENPALTEFVSHELELLEKKNSADRKPTAAQQANENIKADILDALTATPVTITDLQKSSGALGELSNQRISALLRQLVADGLAVRVEDKRKALFALAE